MHSNTLPRSARLTAVTLHSAPDGDGGGSTPAATDGATPPNPATVVNYTPPPADDPDDPDGGGEDWKAKYEATLAEARKHEKRAKANADKARQFDTQQAQSGTDVDKAVREAVAKTTTELRGSYTSKLAQLSIKAAAKGFRNSDDAVALMSSRIGEFVDDDGDVDDKGIAAAVAALLKERPYLAEAAAPPEFDGGTRRGAPGGTDMNATIRRASGISR